MPIHDWRKVDAGTYHDFHLGWIVEMKRALNAGLLPVGYYAQAERQASRYEADNLTLEGETGDDEGLTDVEPNPAGAAATVVAARPRLSVQREADPEVIYAGSRRTLAVRHESGDRLIAIIELASPGNKHRRASVEAFTGKAIAALEAGVHLAVIDPSPPRRADGGGGLVCAIAAEAGFGDFDLPPDKPLCIAAFEAGRPSHFYAEPLAVGDDLPNLPLFYRVGRHVGITLSATYAAAWEATPRRWRQVIEA